MESRTKNTLDAIRILSRKNTTERARSVQNIYALYPEVQPYIVELFSKIIPD